MALFACVLEDLCFARVCFGVMHDHDAETVEGVKDTLVCFLDLLVFLHREGAFEAEFMWSCSCYRV